MNCPVCSSDKTKKILDWKEAYSIWHCTNCALVFTNPVPTIEKLQKFYQGFMSRKPEKHQVEKVIDKRKKELLSLFDFPDKNEMSNASFLDFGGGTGATVKAAEKIGLNAYYLEIDEEAIAFVKEELSFPKDHIYKNLNEVGNKKFDFILADNVIEHDTDPSTFVSNLYGLLNKNGIAVMKTNNARNSEFLFYTIPLYTVFLSYAIKYNSLLKVITAFFYRWWHCDPPRHIYQFSKNSFSVLANTLNIKEFEIDYYRLPLFEHSLNSYFFRKPRNLKGIKALLAKLIILPLLPIEFVIKIIQFIFTAVKVLSPAGIIMIIKRNDD